MLLLLLFPLTNSNGSKSAGLGDTKRIQKVSNQLLSFYYYYNLNPYHHTLYVPSTYSISSYQPIGNRNITRFFDKLAVSACYHYT